MAEKMVAVPQSMLDAIEVSRKQIYEMFPEVDDNTAASCMLMGKLIDITHPIWRLANTRWKEVK